MDADVVLSKLALEIDEHADTINTGSDVVDYLNTVVESFHNTPIPYHIQQHAKRAVTRLGIESRDRHYASENAFFDVIKKVVMAIVNAVKSLLKKIGEFISWLFGSSSKGGGQTAKNTVDDIEKNQKAWAKAMVVNQAVVDDAMRDGLAELGETLLPFEAKKAYAQDSAFKDWLKKQAIKVTGSTAFTAIDSKAPDLPTHFNTCAKGVVEMNTNLTKMAHQLQQLSSALKKVSASVAEYTMRKSADGNDKGKFDVGTVRELFAVDLYGTLRSLGKEASAAEEFEGYVYTDNDYTGHKVAISVTRSIIKPEGKPAMVTDMVQRVDHKSELKVPGLSKSRFEHMTEMPLIDLVEFSKSDISFVKGTQKTMETLRSGVFDDLAGDSEHMIDTMQIQMQKLKDDTGKGEIRILTKVYKTVSVQQTFMLSLCAYSITNAFRLLRLRERLDALASKELTNAYRQYTAESGNKA